MHPWNEPILESIRQRAARLPHALLIHGARGVGKLALAERIGQLLLCEAADPARRPCGACDACRWYLAGNHPDLRRVEPEILQKPVEDADAEAPVKKTRPSREIKVDQIRDLAQFLHLRSHRGAYRVALIHPADTMKENASNALLKGLEEPPAGAVFLLVTHSPAALLPTVRSRCQAIPVPVPPTEIAMSWLQSQGAKGAERWLAYAGGAPLLALQYGEQGALIDRLLKSPGLVEDRDALPLLAEALQKVALDRAFSAFGLEPKYRTGAAGGNARAWLAFARRMGEERQLSSHEVNPKLFSAQLLSSRPKN
ncbi:MAG: DNA polymerase III subunit delta' [Betaproteobacteria bacterium]